MKKKAVLWDPLDDKKVKCNVCAWRCVRAPGKRGFCRTRMNIDGEMYTLIYGSMISPGSLDPIEKKPLYNFWPGAIAYSIASIGCNFTCKHCQNWNISQCTPTENGKSGYFDIQELEGKGMGLYETTPEKLIKKVIDSGAETIAYTYNEPLIWHEFIIDVAKLAHENKILNLLVTNGYSTAEASTELVKYMDAANVDIKAFTDKFYKELCGVPSLQPVLDTCVRWKKAGMHIETTNLIIPNQNDNLDDIRSLAKWVKDNLGPETPLHFSAYYPTFKMSEKRTSYEILDKAYNIAKEEGLYYVYIGNMTHSKGENTYCPNCDSLVLGRSGYSFTKINLKDGNKCGNCGEKLPGLVGQYNPKSKSRRFSFF